MKRLLPLLLLLMLPVASQAQQLHIYCNHLLTVPCTTNAPLTPTNLWDPPWLMGGKSESNFNLLFSPAGLGSVLNVSGVMYGNGLNAPSAATSAQLGSLFNVTGLMLGTGLGAPSAYGGSSCTGGQFPTSENASGVWTCGSVTGFASLSAVQSWSALQTFPAADFALTGLSTAAGTAFACWNSSTGAFSIESTPTCNSYVPVSLSSAQTWSAAQTIPAADLVITSPATATGNDFGCWNSTTHVLSVEPTPTCNGFSPAALNTAQTWSAVQTIPAADLAVTSPSTAVGTGFVCWSSSTNLLTVEAAPTCNNYALNGTNVATSVATPATTYTLVAGDCNTIKTLASGDNITAPSSVLATGCVVIMVLPTGTVTVTQGTSLTLYQVGTTNTGNRTMTGASRVSIIFTDATHAYIDGGGLT